MNLHKIALFLLPFFVFIAAPAAAVPNGDVNLDGIVTIDDAVIALQAAVNLYTPSQVEKVHADVAPLVEGEAKPDGNVSIDDAVAILRKAVGLQDWSYDTLGSLPAFTDLNPDPNIVEVNLTAAPARLSLIPGKETDVFAYNGSVPGPTLEAKEGDQVIVHFTNHLPEATNVHWHGLHIPPDQDGGPWNPVPPGGTTDYVFTLPPGSAGTNWYHPHVHHLTASQVAKGLAGAIVVRAADDPLAAIPEKTLLLWDNKFNDDGSIPPNNQADWLAGREGNLLFVNGKLQPTVSIRNGGVQRWRIINASSARYYRLALSEGTMTQVGSDGGLFEKPVTREEILITPGERVEALVRGSTSPVRTLQLLTLPYDRGGVAPAPGPIELLTTMTASNPPIWPPHIPETLRAVPILDSSAPDMQRDFLLTSHGGMALINGVEFDMERVDEIASLNATEVWTVSSVGSMDHPFHLHGFSFQVLSVNGTPEPFPSWKDTVNVPKQGFVQFVVRFTDFPGKRVYHCHILEHEDMGMMGTLEVK